MSNHHTNNLDEIIMLVFASLGGHSLPEFPTLIPFPREVINFSFFSFSLGKPILGELQNGAKGFFKHFKISNRRIQRCFLFGCSC